MIVFGPQVHGSFSISSGQTLHIDPIKRPFDKAKVLDVYWEAWRTENNTSIVVPVSLVYKGSFDELESLVVVFHNHSAYDAKLNVSFTYYLKNN
ncbi:hypothetical protein [Bacillus inaquosorum]|uniref:hypothetical protein n=1 Tax=Bacillus inaquosorum TaxID=483913 RepID=UPI00227F4527|nr:hypothetical protein [Bacillus inaquosorum]MCY7953010.1 hypothetical protein [Bacillus inaquosorum]MEC0520190.1 hypothetical protein [Bacillus inaquosorum]MEC0607112.1 hypothetical protein [Bacillus inaquosorum]